MSRVYLHLQKISRVFSSVSDQSIYDICNFGRVILYLLLFFVLEMDILSKQLDIVACKKRFNPHPKARFPLVKSLFFADDMLVFFDGSEDSLATIIQTSRTRSILVLAWG